MVAEGMGFAANQEPPGLRFGGIALTAERMITRGKTA
jgi:hypothetical protein